MLQDSFIYVTGMFHFVGIYTTMLEPYLIFNGFSDHLYINKTMKPENFRRAQSVFFAEKFEQPAHTIMHKPSWDTWGTQNWTDPSLQTTTLYQAYRMPIFVNRITPVLLDLEHPAHGNFSVPALTAPWINRDQQYYPLIELYHSMKSGGAIPEYIYGHYPDGLVLPLG